MFIVLLRFSTKKTNAGQFMQGHRAWINRGFAESVFLQTGNLEPLAGGAIIAENASLQDLQNRAMADPFVRENVVTAEILEVTPSRTDTRLSFLHRA